MVFVRQDGRLEPSDIFHGGGRLSGEILERIQCALLVHVLHHVTKFVRDLGGLTEKWLESRHQALRGLGRGEHLLHPVLSLHLSCELRTDTNELIHAHTLHALDLPAIAHD